MNNSPFLIFVDRLGYRPMLFFNRNERNVSIIGACSTIAIVLLIFAIILFYCIEFFLGSGMTVLSSKDQIDQPIALDLNGKLFMFRFMNRFGDKVDPRIADLHVSRWSYDKANWEKELLEVEECQYGRHFPREEYEVLLNNVNISDYLCIHPDSNKTLSYDSDNIQGSHLLVTIVQCTGTTKTGEKCFELPDIQIKLDQESYYFSYSIINTRIDHYDFKSPLQYVQFNNNVIVTTTVSYDYTMFYKYVDYKSDKGWLLNSWNTVQGFQFDESLTEKIIHTDDPPYIYDNAFGSYKFKLSPSSMNSYQRTFPKVTTVIGNISACCKFVLLIGQIIVRIFSTAYYYVDLITLLQPNSALLKKKTSIKDIEHLKKAQSQTKVKTRKMVSIRDRSDRIEINPCISGMWMIFPRMTRRTKQVDLCKRKISELLSVDVLIKNMFSFEVINLNLFDKKNEPTNTSSSAMNFNHIPLKLINGTEIKPGLLCPINNINNNNINNEFQQQQLQLHQYGDGDNMG